MTVSAFDGVDKKAKPVPGLLQTVKKNAGRNSYGRITVRHRGGGNKRKYRIIDFRRDKMEMPAVVQRLEYDPNRSAFIALVKYEDGELRYILAPVAGLTRAQFAKIVVGSLGLTPEYRGTFKDVAEAAWYAPFVDTAAAYGIVNGVGDGKFHPDGAITVQEAATMTARAAALCGIDTALDRLDTPLSAYRDASRVSSWAKASVAYCVSSGLWASGEAALTPSRRISRGEIAQMLYGLLLSANLLQ